jgi:hypothetical protein
VRSMRFGNTERRDWLQSVVGRLQGGDRRPAVRRYAQKFTKAALGLFEH